MNLQHMKYAVAVAETGSINKAADRLFVGQSNLSRAIKELENSLGVAIFERSAHGMELTPEGGVFLRYAKAILQQVDEVEHMFTEGSAKKSTFPSRCRAPAISRRPLPVFPASFPPMRSLKSSTRKPTLCVP